MSEVETEYLAQTLKRRHPRMTHLWEAVACPYCYAQVGDPCVTRTGMRADVSHSARIEYFNEGT